MDGKDIIIALVVALIVGLAILYIVISKKRGKGCIGCPESKSCERCRYGSVCGALKDEPGDDEPSEDEDNEPDEHIGR